MNAPARWTDVGVSLTVTGAGLDADVVATTLGLPETSSEGLRSPENPAGVVDSGPTSWAYIMTEAVAFSPERQITGLVSLLGPRLAAIETLRVAGYAVGVAVSGTADTGAVFLLTPDSMCRLASLGLPVSFTARSVTGAPAEDPLAWLDE